jgi:putative acetyltransferase
MENPETLPKLEMSLYEPKFATAFYELNLQWISQFSEVEPKDLQQLKSPEECVKRGGQIFFCFARW